MAVLFTIDVYDLAKLDRLRPLARWERRTLANLVASARCSLHNFMVAILIATIKCDNFFLLHPKAEIQVFYLYLLCDLSI